jgi:hypothetical protein
MRIELKSKLIEAATYEKDGRVLRLFMTNGQLREFTDVPQTIFEGFAKARSAGAYYMDQVRGHFPSPE